MRIRRRLRQGIKNLARVLADAEEREIARLAKDLRVNVNDCKKIYVPADYMNDSGMQLLWGLEYGGAYMALTSAEYRRAVRSIVRAVMMKVVDVEQN